MTIAKEIMSPEPFTVGPDTEVRELAQTLSEKNYGGAPVVDEDGRVIGVVTVSDLIYQKKNLHLPTVFTIFDAVIPLASAHAIDDQMHKMLGMTVGEIMSEEVVTVDEQTSLEDIATIMSEQGKHLLPVMRGEELVGVIDRSDILRAIVGGA